MFKIGKYAVKYWYLYLFGFICLLLQVGLNMLSPQIIRKIIDDVIGKGELDILPTLLIIILLIGVGVAVFGYFKEFTFDKIGFSISVKMRKDLFKHIQGLSVNYFDKTNTGEIMSRVKDDIDKVTGAFGFIGMLVIEVVIHSTVVLICMFNLSSSLFIIPMIAMPVCAFFAIFLEHKLDKVFEDISEENAQLNTVAQENLAGVRTVKAFARERHEISKFLSHNKRYYELNMKQSKLWIRYYPIFNLVTKLLPIVTIIYGGTKVISGEISLGTLGAFIAYCDNIIWPMEMLGWLSNEFASAFASAKKVRKIYAEKPVITEPENAVKLDTVEGHVTFDHVSLELGDKKILEDITFDLRAGKTLGIMGATGAGKTSIVNLLQRFYDVNEGAIMLDGHDIRELSLDTLRKSSSYVMQEVFLFSDSVKENVKMGMKESLSDDEVVTAMRDAQAADFVEKMEEQYDTIIGERGVGLSGGQKQRISIARALSKKAPVLIMDDSTSALDMETEHSIQDTLNNLKGTTKIIIAHRISAVRYADEIIILEDGKILERGTHEDLLREKGYYYKTYMAQYGEFLAEKVGEENRGNYGKECNKAG